MRIGEVAEVLGVGADTIRFYERSGAVPPPSRTENGYREYGPREIDRLRLVFELRRLDLPLEGAALLAGWCANGHCDVTTQELPTRLAAQREMIETRIAGLRDVADRLATLERHLRDDRRRLPVLGDGGPCCAAAAAIEGLD